MIFSIPARAIALLGLPTSTSANDRDAQEIHPDVDYVPLAVDSECPDDAKMGTDDASKQESRLGDTFAEAAAYVAIAVVPLCTWIIVLTSDPMSMSWFFWHPILQSASISLFAYGILTLQPAIQPRTKAVGLARHQVFMLVLGFPAICLGMLAIVINKSVHSQRHFTTWHGLLGIISLSWMALQVALGGGSVWFKGRLFGGSLRAKRVWKYHRLSGYLLFPLLLTTAHLGGAWSDWSQLHVSDIMRLLVYTIAPAALFVAVVMRIRPSKMAFF